MKIMTETYSYLDRKYTYWIIMLRKIMELVHLNDVHLSFF